MFHLWHLLLTGSASLEYLTLKTHCFLLPPFRVGFYATGISQTVQLPYVGTASSHVSRVTAVLPAAETAPLALWTPQDRQPYHCVPTETAAAAAWLP